MHAVKHNSTIARWVSACVAALAVMLVVVVVALPTENGGNAPSVADSTTISPAENEPSSSNEQTSDSDAGQPPTANALAVEQSARYDGTDCEAGVVLVDLVDWVTPDEAARAFADATGLGGFSVQQTDGNYCRVTLPAELSIDQALDALANSNVVGALQPNFVYFTQVDSKSANGNAGNNATLSTNADLTAAILIDLTGTQADSLQVNDQFASKQWAIEALGLAEAWGIARSAGAVSDTPKAINRTVAIIDEGFKVEHEDLTNLIVDTYDSYKASKGETDPDVLKNVSPTQSDSHGTHVAGIVGAQANNIKGIAGVSYNAQLQLIRGGALVSGSTASFTSLSLATGIEHVLSTASTYNTRVISMSVGGNIGPFSDDVLTGKIDKAYDRGIPVVCSSGNMKSSLGSYTPYINYPSDYEKAVSVINLENDKNGDDAYKRYFTSNYNMDDDDWNKNVSAPGTSIYSTVNTSSKYAYLTGTSMAAPHVSGVLSLMFAVNPNLSAAEAIDLLYSTTTDLNASKNRAGTKFDSETGYGLVNAAAAVAAASSHAVITGAHEILKGESTTLTPPAGSTWTWSSSNADVASVSSNGEVTGISAGMAIITATGANGLTGTHAITVYDPAITGPANLEVDESASYEVASAAGGTWTWSSSNADVLAIDASSGKATAKTAGTAIITAALESNESISATLRVTVINSDAVITRVSGNTALDTMQRIVHQGKWETGGTIVLVTADGYWDGLTASGVAGLAGAPIVMTDGTALSSQARQVIASLKPRRIVLIGGTDALSSRVYNEAYGEAYAAAGTKPLMNRLWGAAADDTAVEAYKLGGTVAATQWESTAFICTDNGYWDALSAAPISYAKHMPIFLTRNSGARLSTEALSAMKEGGITSVYLIGGEDAVKPYVAQQLENNGIRVVDRIWGATAIDTSEKVAAFGVLKQGLTADNLGVATSTGYWDALAGAALCGRMGSMLVIADGPNAPTISSFAKSNKAAVRQAYLFGGTSAISSATEAALKTALN